MKSKNGKRALTILGYLSLILVILVTTFLGACKTTSTSSGPITLVFTDFETADAPHTTQILQPMFAELEKRTNGRVKIEAHYSEELVKLGDTYDAVMKGTVDMGVIAPQHVVGKFALNGIGAVCPLDAIPWKPAQLTLDLFNQFPEMQAQFQGLKVVAIYTPFVSFVGTTKKPIRTLEDGQGLKMISAGATAAERAKGLGWVPMDSPPPMSYQLWQTGVSDGGGVITPGDLFGGFQWGNVIKYVTVIPIGETANWVIMNEAKFNSLPSDIQKVFNDLLKETVTNADKVEGLNYKAAIAEAPSKGVEFIQLSSAEVAKWVAKDKPTVDAWIASINQQGLPGQKFYDAYAQLAKKYSASQYEPK